MDKPTGETPLKEILGELKVWLMEVEAIIWAEEEEVTHTGNKTLSTTRGNDGDKVVLLPCLSGKTNMTATYLPFNSMEDAESATDQALCTGMVCLFPAETAIGNKVSVPNALETERTTLTEDHAGDARLADGNAEMDIEAVVVPAVVTMSSGEEVVATEVDMEGMEVVKVGMEVVMVVLSSIKVLKCSMEVRVMEAKVVLASKAVLEEAVNGDS